MKNNAALAGRVHIPLASSLEAVYTYMRMSLEDPVLSLQDMLRASASSKNCPTVDPAREGVASAEGGQNQKRRQSKNNGQDHDHQGFLEDANTWQEGNSAPDLTGCGRGPSTEDVEVAETTAVSRLPNELADLMDEANEMDTSRRRDIESDASHVLDLRSLVAEGVQGFKTTDEPERISRAGIMAKLLLQVPRGSDWNTQSTR